MHFLWGHQPSGSRRKQLSPEARWDTEHAPPRDKGPRRPTWAQASAHCLAEGDSGARATAADTSVDPAASSCQRLPSQRPNLNPLMTRPTRLFSVSRAQLDPSPQVGALGTSSCWGQDKRAGAPRPGQGWTQATPFTVVTERAERCLWGPGSETRAAQRVRNLYVVWGRSQSLVGTARPEVGCPELGVTCTLFSLERGSFGEQSWGSRGPCKRPPPEQLPPPGKVVSPSPAPSAPMSPWHQTQGTRQGHSGGRPRGPCVTALGAWVGCCPGQELAGVTGGTPIQMALRGL